MKDQPGPVGRAAVEQIADGGADLLQQEAGFEQTLGQIAHEKVTHAGQFPHLPKIVRLCAGEPARRALE